jgi:hypothetical protein
MDDGVLLEEEDKIDVENPDMSGGQHTVSPSRRTGDSLGSEAPGTGAHHGTQGRRSQIPQRIFPGAYRQGGPENEEEGHDEDELTVQSHTEPPLPPTLSADLVNTAEEEKRVQDQIDQALQRERQLVQDQINQALQRERQNAVVAEVVPEVVSNRSRRWKLAVVFFLVILIVVGVVLGITLPQEPEPDPEPIRSPEDLRDLLGFVSSDGGDALQTNSTPQNMAFTWLVVNNTNLGNYTNETIIQRYALATLYFSTDGGESWKRNARWLDDSSECGSWQDYSDDGTVSCTDTGAVVQLDLRFSNLSGTLPPEMGLLSSLGKFVIDERMTFYILLAGQIVLQRSIS